MTITFTKRGDVWGPEGVTNGYSIEISFTEVEMNELQSQYDSASSTSPSVSIARPIVRQILDALKDV
jgi:hypothetical protein